MGYTLNWEHYEPSNKGNQPGARCCLLNTRKTISHPHNQKEKERKTLDEIENWKRKGNLHQRALECFPLVRSRESNTFSRVTTNTEARRRESISRIRLIWGCSFGKYIDSSRNIFCWTLSNHLLFVNMGIPVPVGYISGRYGYKILIPIPVPIFK